MAYDFWKGSTDAWSTAGNWNSGVVPASSDDVLIPANNAQEIQSGLSQGAVDLASLVIAEGYSQNIGASGNYLAISSGLVKHFGSGELWYQDGSGTTDEVWIRTASNSTVTQLDGATFTIVYVMRGALTITGTVTTLEVSHYGNVATDANVTITAGAGTVTTLNQDGGIVNASNTITTANVNAGTMSYSGSGTITTLNVHGGNVVFSSQGTATTCRCYGGVTDFSQSLWERTIGNLWVYPGATVKYDDSLTTVTALHNLGGKIMT